MPTLSLSSSVSLQEGNSGATHFIYTINRSGANDAITVPWRFTAGSTNASDFIGGAYPVGGNVALAAGTATASFTIYVQGDTTSEANEVFTVTIEAPAGYTISGPASATGTIVNDDGARSSVAFKEVSIGGGGWLVGMDIDNAGGMLAKADVYGGYIKKKGDARWSELFNVRSMPAEDRDLYRGAGVYEARFSLSNPERIFMMNNGWLYRTSIRGLSWVKTAFPRLSGEGRDGNNAYRWHGPKMAVDPINGNVVLASSTAGVQLSRDAGNTWAVPTGLPSNSGPRGYAIRFDPSSAIVNLRTQGIYIFCDGAGLYRSTNGGVSFTAVPGGPTSLGQMDVGSTGAVWIAAFQSPAAFTAFKFDGTSFTSVAVNPPVGTVRSPWSVAVHPADPNRIAICAADGRTSLSLDGGVTWSGYKTWSLVKAGSDVPWIADTSAYFMSAGQLKFDPTETNKLYLSAGTGVFWCNPITGTGTNVWRSETAGIEEMVSNTVISPPTCDPFFTFWDRAGFSRDDLDTYPVSMNLPIDPAKEIIHGWHSAYSPQTPTFLAILADNIQLGSFATLSGYSLDGGKTFTQFAALPSDVTMGAKLGGNIAVCDANTVLFFPGQNGRPYRSTNRGASWTRMTFPGVTDTYNAVNGWGDNYVFKRNILTADLVIEGTFYAYNYLTGSVYRTTDKGATWVQRASSLGSKPFNVKMRAAPGAGSKLYLCDGRNGGETITGGNNTPFQRSVDGGASFSPVGTIVGVFDFGFGKPVTGSTPTIVAAGFVNGAFGVYWSADDCATWTLIEQFPARSLDEVVAVNGDMNVPKRFYVGLYGSSFRYIDIA